MAGRVKLGPWGGDGGDSRDIDGYPTRLTKIIIHSGLAIFSIAFDYVQDGKTITVGPWGGSEGNPTTIEFQPGEYLTAINGTIGPFSHIAEVVRSLTFVTNLRKLGPIGVEAGAHFSIPIEHGRIVAFFGRSGTLVDALGIYLLPN